MKVGIYLVLTSRVDDAAEIKFVLCAYVVPKQLKMALLRPETIADRVFFNKGYKLLDILVNIYLFYT